MLRLSIRTVRVRAMAKRVLWLAMVYTLAHGTHGMHFAAAVYMMPIVLVDIVCVEKVWISLLPVLLLVRPSVPGSSCDMFVCTGTCRRVCPADRQTNARS